jgi:type IV pilus assembly protein PilO
MNQILIEILRLKKIAFVLILVLILINIALAVFINSYQTVGLVASQTKWSELRRKVASIGRTDSSTMYRQGLDGLEKIKLKIPAKREFGRVLSDLLEDASSSGVMVGSISYKPSIIKDEGLLSYQVSFQVAGGYASIKSYLADLQKNPELIVVDDIALSNSDPFVENVVMDLHITVYLQGGA